MPRLFSSRFSKIYNTINWGVTQILDLSCFFFGGGASLTSLLGQTKPVTDMATARNKGRARVRLSASVRFRLGLGLLIIGWPWLGLYLLLSCVA